MWYCSIITSFLQERINMVPPEIFRFVFSQLFCVVHIFVTPRVAIPCVAIPRIVVSRLVISTHIHTYIKNKETRQTSYKRVDKSDLETSLSLL